MSADPITGQSIRWSYTDGPVKGQRFEHVFSRDGTVRFRQLKDGGGDFSEKPVHYEVARISDDVFAVSYLATSGWTLTTIIDTAQRSITSFASNEKQLFVQRGRLDT